jgi:hypothetical protein
VSAPDVEALQHRAGGARVVRDEESRRLRESSKWRSRLVLIELIVLLLIVLLADISLFVLVRAL